MATVLSPLEQRIVLHNVSWETYERLLAENPESPSPRFTYDQGELEIMTLSPKHEWPSRLISKLVDLIARERRLDVLDLGSTTFKREVLQRGFEPDSCFYIRHASEMRGKKRIDPGVDPPPEIVVEIVVTQPLIHKLPIYAAFGVPEIWSYDGRRLTIYRLSGTEYVEADSSQALPGVTAAELTELVELGKSKDSVSWSDEVLKRLRKS